MEPPKVKQQEKKRIWESSKIQQELMDPPKIQATPPEIETAFADPPKIQGTYQKYNNNKKIYQKYNAPYKQAVKNA
jgi:hypothetical protein